MVAMPAQPDPAASTVAVRRVRVVLPSSPPHDDKHLARGIEWLQAAGVEVEGPGERGVRPLRHLAGPDSERAHELLMFLNDAPADAVWCGRGGSGALRTLDAIDALVAWLRSADTPETPRLHAPIAPSPSQSRGTAQGVALRKPLVGLSDATALLHWWALTEGGAAIHGPVVTQLPRLDDQSADALKTWLRHPDRLPTLRADAPARFSASMLAR